MWFRNLLIEQHFCDCFCCLSCLLPEGCCQSDLISTMGIDIKNCPCRNDTTKLLLQTHCLGAKLNVVFFLIPYHPMLIFYRIKTITPRSIGQRNAIQSFHRLYTITLSVHTKAA